MKSVLLFRNFKEDRRTSMEIYADNLHRAMRKIDNEFEVTCFRPSTRFTKNGTAGKWAMRYARYFEYPAQIKKVNSEIYHIAEHGYAHLLKHLPPERTIVTVHDLIPLLRYKGKITGVRPGKKPRLAEYTLSYLKRAGHIIAVSQNTKNDLIELCGCSDHQISVVYEGSLKITSCESLSKERARSDLDLPDISIKLVLVTGQDFYKNLDTSVRVYNRLVKTYPEIKLVHLGRNTEIWQNARALANDPDAIIELSEISNHDVVKLYTAVDCVLFPSWYEGFGLPPVEAMACGTPVVTSRSGSLPEAAGNAALTADAEDVDALSLAVEKLLYDPSIRESVILKGLDHAKQFTWDRCAKDTQQVYKNVLERLN